MPLKPSPAFTAETLGQSVLIVLAESGETPRRGVAERFASVAAPSAGATLHIRIGKLVLAPLGAPTQITFGALGKFDRQDLFPSSSPRVRKTNPGEMENFVNQDALKIAAGAEHLPIEQDDAAGNRRSGEVRSEGGAQANPDGLSGERGHGFILAARCRGPA
jgi:hypothetical protein